MSFKVGDTEVQRKIWTPERRAAQSARNRGKKISPETRARISKSKKGVPCNRKRPYEHYLASIRNNTQREFLLTYEDVLELVQEDRCFYCHLELVWFEFSPSWRTPPSNLDRKDSSKGYSSDNVVPCCWRCNQGKSNLFSFETWYAMTAVFRVLDVPALKGVPMTV